MAEALLEYENTVEDPDGESWIAEAMGAERDDGTWVGWIRFRKVDGKTLLETDRETTQPNRDDLVYWTKGLTYSYRSVKRFTFPSTGARPSPPHPGTRT